MSKAIESNSDILSYIDNYDINKKFSSIGEINGSIIATGVFNCTTKKFDTKDYPVAFHMSKIKPGSVSSGKRYVFSTEPMFTYNNHCNTNDPADPTGVAFKQLMYKQFHSDVTDLASAMPKRADPMSDRDACRKAVTVVNRLTHIKFWLPSYLRGRGYMAPGGLFLRYIIIKTGI